MKRNLVSGVLIFGLGLLLVGCSNQPDKTQESSQVSTESTSKSTTEGSEQAMTETSTTTDKSQTRSEFTAVLSEDATPSEKDSQQLRLFLSDVTAKEDPEDMLKMLADGFILNVKTDQLGKDTSVDTLKQGTKVTFVLRGVPMMTMSLPPQLAGNSVEEVTSN